MSGFQKKREHMNDSIHSESVTSKEMHSYCGMLLLDSYEKISVKLLIFIDIRQF